jgi:acyl-CoA reductase-like NAD-dependent aldehyde dehydrogenase
MRLRVQKTLKMYVGGQFIRSESGRVLPFTAADGAPMNACRASRKDLRDSIANNRASLAGWSGRTAYLRGQILYRMGEMLESRSLPCAAEDQVAAVDRAVHHAGWSDKITAILSTLNPVAAAYVNYSMVRPMGVLVGFPDPSDGLLGMVEAASAILVMGNAGTIVVPAGQAELATAFSEVVHTSDIPSGTLNILTGDVGELLAAANLHDDIDGIVSWGGAIDEVAWTEAERAGARTLRRMNRFAAAARPAGPDLLAKLAEVKTVWMSAAPEIPAGRGGY